MIRTTTASIALTAAMAMSTSAAEFEISAYTGFQTAPHSRVDVVGNDGGNKSIGAGWEGRSFEMPPYYGLRGTWWINDKWGVGAEFNHAKVYADASTLTANGLSVLEFSDGINYLTVNGWRRWQNPNSRWTPYAGAGIGLSIPHVEYQAIGGSRTYEYQVTGAVVQLVGGVSYAINDTWSLYGEYKGAYSMNKADLVGGGTLETNIITNALNVGVSYSF